MAVRQVFGEALGVGGGMSLSSRAQMMRTEPVKVRCSSAHLSSCSGFGTLVSSWRILGFSQNGWIQLWKRSWEPVAWTEADDHEEMGDPARPQQLGDQEGAAGQRCVDGQQPARVPGRVVVEGLAGDQDQVGDTIGAAMRSCAPPQSLQTTVTWCRSSSVGNLASVVASAGRERAEQHHHRPITAGVALRLVDVVRRCMVPAIVYYDIGVWGLTGLPVFWDLLSSPGEELR